MQPLKHVMTEISMMEMSVQTAVEQLFVVMDLFTKE